MSGLLLKEKEADRNREEDQPRTRLIWIQQVREEPSSLALHICNSLEAYTLVLGEQDSLWLGEERFISKSTQDGQWEDANGTAACLLNGRSG